MSTANQLLDEARQLTAGFVGERRSGTTKVTTSWAEVRSAESQQVTLTAVRLTSVAGAEPKEEQVAQVSGPSLEAAAAALVEKLRAR